MSNIFLLVIILLQFLAGLTYILQNKDLLGILVITYGCGNFILLLMGTK